MSQPGLIYKKMIDVMRDIEHVSKGRKNVQQGYAFRGVDDVYIGLHKVLARHGVFTVPKVLAERTEDRTTAKGSALIYRVLTMQYTFFAEDGSSVEVEVIGEGMDSGDKASNKAMSVAHKYALIQVFAIPTEEAKDPEVDSHELLPVYVGSPQQKKVLKSEIEAFGIPREQWSKVHEDAVLAKITMENLHGFVEDFTRA